MGILDGLLIYSNTTLVKVKSTLSEKIRTSQNDIHSLS